MTQPFAPRTIPDDISRLGQRDGSLSVNLADAVIGDPRGTLAKGSHSFKKIDTDQLYLFGAKKL